MYQDVNQEVGAIFDDAKNGQAAASAAEAYQQENDRESDSFELEVITGEQLINYPFKRRDYLVSGLLQDGLTVLAGSPKVGKSWLVLYLCLQVCSGQDFLGCGVKRGDVLYLALEDTPRRLSERMSNLSDHCGRGLYLATRSHALGDGLIKELRNFIRQHPLTRLIVIDTFQKVRKAGKEMSYANDYSDVSRLKELADSNGICILLVHHTRKMADNDYMNEISGTNGIAGSADALMVLKRENRRSRSATLSCTGRDIEDREFKLTLNRETCIWEVTADSRGDEAQSLPKELTELVEYMKEIKTFEGSNSDFVNSFCSARGCVIDASHLKRSMNRYRDALAEHGVEFLSGRVDNRRVLGVVYYGNSTADASEADEEAVPVQPQVGQPQIGQPQVEQSQVEQPQVEQPQVGQLQIESRYASDPTQGSLYRDDDYMESLLSDDAYVPRTSLSEVALEEEESLWDRL